MPATWVAERGDFFSLVAESQLLKPRYQVLCLLLFS